MCHVVSTADSTNRAGALNLNPSAGGKGVRSSFWSYRGTSLMRNSPPQDPTVGLCLGPYGGLGGGLLFLVSEVPL